MDLLEKLCSIPGASSDEGTIRGFILDYIAKEKQSWYMQPEVFYGEEFQDCVILVFGKPRVAVYAHLDTVGFTVGYHNNLIRIGSPKLIDGTLLVGRDAFGEIEAELMLIEEDDQTYLQCVFEREIERGTILTFKPNFRDDEHFIRSPYLDNRLGVWNALRLAETIEDGALVFSTYEEHGGNSVAACARFLHENYAVRRALISDITWITEGVRAGLGVAISMRDSGLPRRSYLNEILSLANKAGVPYQFEVESAGGSDGTMLQRSEILVDWCFIGAAENHVHSPNEEVHKHDISSMLDLYRYLIKFL